MTTVLVDEAFFDTLLAKALPPPYLEDLDDLKLDDMEKSYFDRIIELIEEHKILAIAFLSTVGAKFLINNPLSLNNHFFDNVEDEIRTNTLKYESAIDKIIEDKYHEGAAEGFKQLNRKFVASIADDYTLKFLKNYNFDLIKTVSNDLKVALRREIWEGITKKESANQITRRIEKLNLKPIRAGNRTISPHERAKMIARTETMRVKNAAKLMSYKHYGVKKVRVPRIFDARECGKCIIVCDDSPYTIDEAEGILPVHVVCRHTFAPDGDWTEEPVELSENDYVFMINKVGGLII